MTTARVLVSGASIAGPALAFWLHRYGYDVTVVEKADQIRRGGQAVDLKGPVHRTVLTRMGILDAVAAAHVPNADGITVDASGRKVGTIPGAFAGGEINVPRGDLAAILYDLTADTCRYVFDDSITSLTETDTGVDVTFARSAPETFDIVVGADGMHSHVRALAFGPESAYVEHLGFCYVLAKLDTGPEDMMYNEPGRMVAIGGPKAPAFFVFASDQPPTARDDVEAQKRQLIDAFAGSGWRVPELLAQVPAAQEFYLDSISRATVEHYSTGRVVLLGDAAYGNALGGFGTGLALVGAYVLAGELATADGDHQKAFRSYEAAIRGYAAVSQKVNAGRLLAPRTRPGIWVRNLMFSSLSLVGPLMKIIDRPASNITLADYPSLLPTTRA
ncbi:FAD-dependent oxidoreductase [Modestobacter sp. I12A-02628]|uniref:FAD-dependent oxidoreductase n=1 Tax=Goekera deserti TaxID=2497753 RepID=A0A7K3WHH6_9ACTN|nr:FAD-dependent monooxygenase [Goekera deserti]MPQ99080.1 FAD-dependent oxidoreductase [Goekera deserti]NDI47414.1 FAD-dependent oxidoreductase [Goekera deserti]NEL55945.1 FAD-dependent oxidoreductase [Goekera deserti]